MDWILRYIKTYHYMLGICLKTKSTNNKDNNIIDFSLAYTPEIQVDVEYKKYTNK